MHWCRACCCSRWLRTQCATGWRHLIEGGWIAIKSALDADRLRIVIGNSGRRGEGEQKKNGNGIGLGNTAERLKTLYGTDFEFSLVWPEAGGCEVVLELPLRRARNLQEASPCAL